MILQDGVSFELWVPEKEEMLEGIVKEHSRDIWGENSLYFGKKSLRTEAGVVSIPDGYVLVFDNPPDWYIVEVELSSHRLYDHIVPQISKFAQSLKKIENQRALVEAIDADIANDEVTRAWVKRRVAPLEVHKFLTALIAKSPKLTIVIDKKTPELDEVIDQVSVAFAAAVPMEFKTYQREGCGLRVHLHLFEPLCERRIAGEEGEPIVGAVTETALDEPLKKASPDTWRLFLGLRGRILKLGSGIWESPGASWVDFRKTTTFTSVNLQKKKLVVFIKMGDKTVNDPKGMTSHVGWYGKLNTRFPVHSADDLDYAMHLIKQAYDYVP